MGSGPVTTLGLHRYPVMLARLAALWLPLAVASSVMAVVLYAAVQQDLRLGADDPQIQLAHDAAAALDSGSPVEQVLPPASVDPERSLAPFVVVYDRHPSRLAGTLSPSWDPPSGVFQKALDSGENRRTWQPSPGVRIAAVIVPFRGGYVLSGRSLSEVERREAQILQLVLGGWFATMLAGAAAAMAGAQLLGRKVSITLG